MNWPSLPLQLYINTIPEKLPDSEKPEKGTLEKKKTSTNHEFKCFSGSMLVFVYFRFVFFNTLKNIWKFGSWTPATNSSAKSKDVQQALQLILQSEDSLAKALRHIQERTNRHQVNQQNKKQVIFYIWPQKVFNS